MTRNIQLSVALSLGGSIHDDPYSTLYVDSFGNNIEVRSITAGMQACSHIGFNFVRTKEHEFQIRLGGLIRFQSSSDNDFSITSVSPQTNPVISISNNTPQRTVSAGASIQLLYNYTLGNYLTVGILAGIQTVTNGDLIRQSSLSIGKRFKN